MNNFYTYFDGLRPLWERLQSTQKPIVLYGMGDGALKIMRILKEKNIPLAGIFASDDFARNHTFQGFPVRTLAQTLEQFGEVVILLAFGTQRPELMDYLKTLFETHELYAPDVPVCADDTTLFDRTYLETHAEDFNRVYTRLADRRSKEVFLDVLRYKLTGKLCYLDRATDPVEEPYTRLIPPHDAEHFLDLGAYNGDTVQAFLARVTDYSSITAWEPDRRNFKKLLKTIEDLPRTTAFQWGVHDAPTTLHFAARGGRNASLVAVGDTQVPTNQKHTVAVDMESIDHAMQGRPITMIKFDVEGAEEQALRGGHQTLVTQYPKLELAAYHRNSDLWKLPALLWELAPDYDIFLRHHPYYPAWETNFYCRLRTASAGIAD